MVSSYPVQFDVDFPARPLGRLATAFRIFAAIPIVILLSMLSGETINSGNDKTTYEWAAARCSSCLSS